MQDKNNNDSKVVQESPAEYKARLRAVGIIGLVVGIPYAILGCGFHLWNYHSESSFKQALIQLSPFVSILAVVLSIWNLWRASRIKIEPKAKEQSNA